MSGVDFINGIAPLCPTLAPCAQLLRSFLLAQMLGAGRERLAQGAKQFMKSTLVDLHDGANDQPTYANQTFIQNPKPNQN